MKNYDFLKLQQEQYKHDMRNHFDIISMSKNDRLKHYAMHYAKYAGRLALGDEEVKTKEETIIDTVLVCLSAANTLHQKISYQKSDRKIGHVLLPKEIEQILLLTDASGRFNNAAEKIDHMEPFIEIARESNLDIFSTILEMSESFNVDVVQSLNSRRLHLKERQFFIGG